jgi:hypothetical protein
LPRAVLTATAVTLYFHQNLYAPYSGLQMYHLSASPTPLTKPSPTEDSFFIKAAKGWVRISSSFAKSPAKKATTSTSAPATPNAPTNDKSNYGGNSNNGKDNTDSSTSPQQHQQVRKVQRFADCPSPPENNENAIIIWDNEARSSNGAIGQLTSQQWLELESLISHLNVIGVASILW